LAYNAFVYIYGVNNQTTYMQKLLLMWAVLFCAAVYPQQSKLLASCCDATPKSEIKNFGRCSGDASCTACTNCRYCKHCSKEGGSCGVCTTYEAPKKVRSTPKRKTTAAKLPAQYRRNQMLEVTSETLNVREGAGTGYDIVETLNQGDMLTFISYEGEWINVRVDTSGETGYVYYKYVK
jgi:hypothetical protein